MKINDEGTSNAAHWHERAMKAEARLAEAEAQAKQWKLVSEQKDDARAKMVSLWYDEIDRANAAEARLAEAEHLILRMAREDYQRARFYVEKYDLTGERATVSATACPQCNGRKKFEVAGREIWCPICNGTGSTVNGDSATAAQPDAGDIEQEARQWGEDVGSRT